MYLQNIRMVVQCSHNTKHGNKVLRQREVRTMSEKEKQVMDYLKKQSGNLTDEQLQRLSDIAYGMMLAQESKKEQDKQTA